MSSGGLWLKLQEGGIKKLWEWRQRSGMDVRGDACDEKEREKQGSATGLAYPLMFYDAMLNPESLEGEMQLCFASRGLPYRLIMMDDSYLQVAGIARLNRPAVPLPNE